MGKRAIKQILCTLTTPSAQQTPCMDTICRDERLDLIKKTYFPDLQGYEISQSIDAGLSALEDTGLYKGFCDKKTTSSQFTKSVDTDQYAVTAQDFEAFCELLDQRAEKANAPQQRNG